MNKDPDIKIFKTSTISIKFYYNGHEGSCEYEDFDNLWCGVITTEGFSNLVYYEGKTILTCFNDFKEAVDQYLDLFKMLKEEEETRR